MIFNFNQSPEKVARDLVRAIEDYLWESGVKVEFGKEGLSLIDGFIDQYNTLLSREHDEAAQQDIENQKLRAALEEISEWMSDYPADDQIVSIQNTARKALGKLTQDF